jgi:hypothetical protein
VPPHRICLSRLSLAAVAHVWLHYICVLLGYFRAAALFDSHKVWLRVSYLELLIVAQLEAFVLSEEKGTWGLGLVR